MNKTVYKHASVFVPKPNNWVGLTVVNVRAVKNAVQLHEKRKLYCAFIRLLKPLCCTPTYFIYHFPISNVYRVRGILYIYP